LEEIYRSENDGSRRSVKAEDLSLAHAAMLCLLKLRILRDLRSVD
jgi:hypothetical protein